MTTLYRDECLDLRFILAANEAEQWAHKMIFLAAECRKEKPTTERFSMKQVKRLWRKTLNRFTSL